MSFQKWQTITIGNDEEEIPVEIWTVQLDQLAKLEELAKIPGSGICRCIGKLARAVDSKLGARFRKFQKLPVKMCKPEVICVIKRTINNFAV